MINATNDNKRNATMEAYDDRPISTYDNLNNMTANMSAIAATTNSRKPVMIKTPAMADTHEAFTLTATPPTSSKANGAAHSTPFTDISFRFNENNTPHQKHQQLQMTGNRNLNEMPPNTANASVYATPYQTAVIKPVISTASPVQTAQQLQLQQNSPSRATTSETTTSASSPLSTHTTGTTTPAATPTAAAAAAAPAAAATAALSPDGCKSFNRPLSQHSQSELNDTSNSIAAVKAALNEAKSKFFGLNGYAAQPPQQSPAQYEQHSDENSYGDKSFNRHLLTSDFYLQQHLQQVPSIHPAQQHQQQQQPLQLQQQVQKPQPKYQNIPENSAIFRIQNASGGDAGPPALPPKPVEYQNLQQQPPTRSTQASTPDHNRKMPTASSPHTQISLSDIDGAASRSQTVYMATTVPQNIKGNKIAGRHTPTRSSLRHSRMLVVNNKNYEEVQRPNPMGFQQPSLARWLLILQVTIALLVISLSAWIFFVTPNAPVQDNPYWCGVVLLITAITGLILIRYRRLKRAKVRDRCFMFLRMASYVLSLLAVLLCCVALMFAAIHYCRLTAADTICKRMHLSKEHGSCICTFHAPPVTLNATQSLFDDDETNQMTGASYNVVYRDLSCEEVTGSWTSILGLSFILNALGFATSLVFIVLLACCRRPSQRVYTTVRTSTF